MSKLFSGEMLENSQIEILAKDSRVYGGSVNVSGSKNTVTKLMVVAMMTKEISIIENVPEISEINVIAEIMKLYNIEVAYDKERHSLTIDPSQMRALNIETFKKYISIKSTSRIPILFCGPLMHCFNEAYIPSVSGCAIGGRSIDFHLSIFNSFGVSVEDNEYFLKLKRVREVSTGQHITLPFPSIGATEQAIFFSVLNSGTSIIENVAMEPEIMDIIQVLQKMGAVINISANRKLNIVGVSKLKGFKHVVIGDKLEAASWAALALASNGEIIVKNITHTLMYGFLNKYVQAGGGFEILYSERGAEIGIRFYRSEKEVRAITIETDVYPGYQTDWQQPMLVALTQADGVSIIHEKVYERRFDFVETINTMGANINLFTDCLGGSKCRYTYRDYRHSAVISGKTLLRGTTMKIPDLRAGFSYLIAALIAERGSISRIKNIQVLSRGYEKLLSKIRAVGGEIRLTKSDD